MTNTLVYLLLILGIIALLIAGPIITILALNVLFGLGLSINFATYFSMLWIQWLLAGAKTVQAVKSKL